MLKHEVIEEYNKAKKTVYELSFWTRLAVFLFTDTIYYRIY